MFGEPCWAVCPTVDVSVWMHVCVWGGVEVGVKRALLK